MTDRTEGLTAHDPIKRISVAEFRRLGFLQEVNRRLLHPAGLALEVRIKPDGTEEFGQVWDYRDDPEGIVFEQGTIELGKVQSVGAEIERHIQARIRLFGNVIQPVRASGEG